MAVAWTVSEKNALALVSTIFYLNKKKKLFFDLQLTRKFLQRSTTGSEEELQNSLNKEAASGSIRLFLFHLFFKEKFDLNDN